MPNPRLASRYARSLLELAIDQNQVERVFADLLWLQQVLKTSREFANLLKSPIIKPEKKEKTVDAVIRGRVSEIIFSFIHLIISKGRESNLKEIIPAFITQYKEYRNIYTVKLTTAVPIDEALQNKIIEQVKRTSEMHNIELQTMVNKDLIGGFILEAGDKLIDASIAYELKQLSRKFENNDFIYRIR